jgi:hypothetical protein
MQVLDKEILETIDALKDAQENLKRIEEKYSNKPMLLNFYRPSAQELVNRLQSHLKFLLQKATNIEFDIKSIPESIDIWVRIEGDEFEHGKGPINIVGSYLQKFNTAFKHTVSLMLERLNDFTEQEQIRFPTLNLATTQEGSLKLGLKYSIDPKEQETQISFFDKEDLLERLEKFDKLQKISRESLILLMRVLASVNDKKILEELKTQFDEKDVLKLIHYAKELVPSSRSQIKYISFEGIPGILDKPIKTDRETRKFLSEKAKSLKKDTKYVEGTALIRGYESDLDLDYFTLTARPFKYEEEKIPSIECRLIKKSHKESILQFADQFVYISGFLIYNSNNQPVRLDVDEILIKNGDED